MKVSVSLITYNHEKYIAQAIDSVLMQKTNFDYEIIIGEDDSEDNTRTIVQEYKKRYPDKIKLFLNDRKNVIYINGKATGRWNLVNNLKHARGKYIALLDGDDYWTDPLKIQKQVDFLDGNPECSMCFHAVNIIWDDKSREPTTDFPLELKEIYTIEDLLGRDSNFIRTCSVMFRNELFNEFPSWFYETPQGDWILHILNAQYGNIGFVNKIMGTYRIHEGGVWSQTNEAEDLKRRIKSREIVKQNLNPKYRKLLTSAQYEQYWNLLRTYLAQGDRANAILYFRKGFIGYFHSKDKTIGSLIRMLLHVFSPTLYGRLRNVKKKWCKNGHV